MLYYILSSILIVYSLVVTYYCIKFAMTILRVQDSLQSALDVVGEKYEAISEILSRPLFFDSPEVRQVLDDIESTRDALEIVAHDLANKIENDVEEENIINEG
jgi:hypothetical protein